MGFDMSRLRENLTLQGLIFNHKKSVEEKKT